MFNKIRAILFFLILGFFFTAHANQVWVLSDIHFNPFADCVSEKCPLTTKLDKATASEWPQIFAQNASNQLPKNGQTTNYALFHSLLNQLQQEKPENVIILGDFLAHRYRTQYLKYTGDHNRAHYNNFVIKTMQFITDSIQQVLPAQSAIYPVIGNNDSYGGKDCAYADYCINPALYKSLIPYWAPLFRDDNNKNQFTMGFPQAGYYEIALPNSHNHIIVLNTVLFSSKAQGPNAYITAQNQIKWLSQRLADFAKTNDKAWIIFHIPPGIDANSSVKNFFGLVIPFWDKDYSQKFLDLVHQYNSVITGVLSGHTHMDGFLVLDKNHDPNIIDSFVPSISPIFGNNPAYKIYNYDLNNFLLGSFTTYFLNLKDDSGKNGWQKEYDSTSAEKISADPQNPFSVSYMQFYNAQAAG